MPAGHNGPYHHKESPLRNTGHWLYTWAHLWRLDGDRRFRDAASKALAYVLLDTHRPQKANWMQRMQKGRDACNGVIGAAWTGEALWAAALCLNSEDALRHAKDVFLKHVFDSRAGLWQRLEPDGRVLSIDQTFNHQLWFAATTARLINAGVDELEEPLEKFMDGLPRIFAIGKSGVIRHRIPLYWRDHIFYPGGIPFKIFQTCKSLKTGLKPVDAASRDLGYHAFNLHAFAILHRHIPEHAFWESSGWLAALAFARSEKHINGVAMGNPYAYPYNPVGFEMAFALRRFVPGSEEEQQQWLERQWSVLTCDQTLCYGQEAADPVTAKARLYEAVEWLVESDF